METTHRGDGLPWMEFTEEKRLPRMDLGYLQMEPIEKMGLLGWSQD
jgi:hypothetical protein